MEEPIETGRQFINTWNCDENRHMNVQFYFTFFEQADAHFWFRAGLSEPSTFPRLSTQHVRFHKELSEGDLIVVHSHLAPRNGGFALCHIMSDAEDGSLTATSWSPLAEYEFARLDLPVLEAIPDALPRSFQDEPARQISLSTAAEAGFAVCLKSVVHSSECDADGLISTKGIIGNLSDAASHFWSHIGLSKKWLNDNNFGRVALEFKITKFANIRAGTPIIVRSGLIDFTGKTITFRHYMFDLNSMQATAAVDVTGIAIDLDVRKAVRMDEDHEATLKARLVSSIEN